MKQEEINAIVEGLLFLSGDEGLQLAQIVACFDNEVSSDEILEALAHLQMRTNDSAFGVALVCFGDVYKLVTKEVVHPYAQQLFQSTKMMTLSNAALETLAIIAYKQPITRVEIEEIRGVNADNMIRKLLARNFVKEAGRSDAPGKPFLYEVTSDFMDSFQIEQLKDLPDLPKINEEEQQSLFNEE